jgi:hypothetical protein
LVDYTRVSIGSITFLLQHEVLQSDIEKSVILLMDFTQYIAYLFSEPSCIFRRVLNGMFSIFSIKVFHPNTNLSYIRSFHFKRRVQFSRIPLDGITIF